MSRSIVVEIDGREYTLAFNRAIARNTIQSMNVMEQDSFSQIDTLISQSLKLYHGDLSDNELMQIVQKIEDEYPIVGNNENDNIGQMLNAMIGECIPKGFTGQAIKMFKVKEN